MKITVESTKRLIDFHAQRGSKPIKCRVWEGQSESGIAVQVLIPYIAAIEDGAQKLLEDELTGDLRNL